MLSLSTIVLVLLTVWSNIVVVYATSEICSSEFPTHQTNRLLEMVVRQYAHEEIFVDLSTGQHSTRKVISESNLFIPAIQKLYLQPKSHSRECTYRFEAKRYFRVPIYVHLSATEEAYPFNRLHFMCPVNTTCCGLYCCPHETQIIQEEFIALSSPATDESELRRIDDNTSIEKNAAIYSLSKFPKIHNNEHICTYHLSDEDLLRRTARLNSEEAPNAIYFVCPDSSHCCQLKCVPSKTVSLRVSRIHSREVSISSFHLYEMYIPWSVIIIMILAMFFYILYRIYKQNQPKGYQSFYLQHPSSSVDSNDIIQHAPIHQFSRPNECKLI